MSIIPLLATSLNRRDELPNQDLAAQIATRKDAAAIEELMDHLQYHKNKNIQHDCIKVLYEIALLEPSLVARYIPNFIDLLQHQNNRLQWGAMTALSALAPQNTKAVFAALPQIVAAADNGSVITRDHCVEILMTLCAVKMYAEPAFILFTEQLKTCPVNQLPMYAEKAIPVINDLNRGVFVKTLSSRLDEVEKESKRKRIEKVIKKFSK